VQHAAVVLVLAFVAGVALYPWLTTQLARGGAGQRVQTYNPSSHMIKIGTPTIGGVQFCAIAVVAWLVFDRTRLGFVVVFALGAGAVLGLLDDRDNVRGRGVFGLGAYEKIGFQALIGLLVGIGLDVAGATRQYFPGLGAPDLRGAGIIVVSILAVIAVSNAVNLTDGVDGLASKPSGQLHGPPLTCELAGSRDWTRTSNSSERQSIGGVVRRRLGCVTRGWLVSCWSWFRRGSAGLAASDCGWWAAGLV